MNLIGSGRQLTGADAAAAAPAGLAATSAAGPSAGARAGAVAGTSAAAQHIPQLAAQSGRYIQLLRCSVHHNYSCEAALLHTKNIGLPPAAADGTVASVRLGSRTVSITYSELVQTGVAADRVPLPVTPDAVTCHPTAGPLQKPSEKGVNDSTDTHCTETAHYAVHPTGMQRECPNDGCFCWLIYTGWRVSTA
jgi:hypothetical protein